MSKLVYFDSYSIRHMLRKRFAETAINNAGISSEDISLVYEDAADRVDLWLNKATPADVRPVIRGKWILMGSVIGGRAYGCSWCGYITKETVMGESMFNFCPMCGMMREAGGG